MINFKKVLLAFFSIFLFFAVNQIASAATIQTTPATGSYKVGDTFKVDVTVSSPDKSINAVSGILSFPKDKLQFISISKTSSILSIWAQEPSYYDSGENGNISFEGVIPNPGFTGTRGRILSVTFKVKATWQAELSFSSASVLANDGLGTNVLTNSLPGIFTLNSSITPYVAPTETEPTVQVASNVPSEAQITSTTHPDQDKWYNNNNPSFKWTLPNNITGVRIYGDQNPNTELPKTSQGLSSSHTYKNVADGTWYLHIRLRNSAGWNDTTHFKFNIDTLPPEPFAIEFPDGKETSNSKPRLAFNAIDEISGIDHYEIAINDIIVNASLETGKNNVYVLPNQTPGEKEVSVKAYDKAGNFYEAKGKFTVLTEPCPQPKEETNKINYLLIVELLIALNLILITLVIYLIYTKIHKVNNVED